MDKNTITGLILIFVIFIGFSIYNSSNRNKNFEKTVAVAEADVAKGDLESARAEYINALRFKPNQPEVLAKLNELNTKLGISPDQQEKDTSNLGIAKKDTVKQEQVSAENEVNTGPEQTTTQAGQYGVFSDDATGTNDFITLENNKLVLKIALKGGRVYSARLKRLQDL